MSGARPGGVRMLVAALIAIAGGYLLICALAFAAQRSMLYPAPRMERTPRAPHASLVELRSPAGRPVFALHAPAPAGARTVVHFHGNGEDLADASWLVAELRTAGLGVLSVEYPGYGPARAQSISEEAIYEAAETAIGHLKDARIALLGISLGSGVAVEMARRGHGERLALVTPYTSIADAAAHHFPWLPVRLLMRDRFDSAAKAAQLRRPALVVHGTGDEVIPFALGERLSKLLPGARLVRVEGAHHNDVLMRALPELIAFLRGA